MTCLIDPKNDLAYKLLIDIGTGSDYIVQKCREMLAEKNPDTSKVISLLALHMELNSVDLKEFIEASVKNGLEIMNNPRPPEPAGRDVEVAGAVNTLTSLDQPIPESTIKITAPTELDIKRSFLNKPVVQPGQCEKCAPFPCACEVT